MQVPALDTEHEKLASFVDGVPSLANSSKVKDDLAQEIFPWPTALRREIESPN
jgi:hypothetical protein